MEKRFYWIIVIALLFFFVGMLGYFLAPAKRSKLPNRILLPSSVGSVVFSHEAHYASYKLSCRECHHHPDTKKPSFVSCRTCHTATVEGTPYLKTCTECHEATSVQKTPMLNTKDAFHKQCIGCHTANKVPVTDCSSCHGKS